MADSWDLQEGDQIVPGRYAVRRLGGGVRFEVYLALDEHLATTVAIKLLRPDQIDDEAGLDALRIEARALERLSHPSIVRSFAVQLDGPRPHLVLEHLEGPTLRSLVKRYGPLPLEQLVPLTLQMCAALHYMAAEGWVHLDVKPANVVMSMTPKLVDLSIARTIEEAAATPGGIGTFDFMAPEQCTPGDRGVPGPPSDIWGLGMTLYRAVTGKHPFTRPDPIATDPTLRFPQLTEDPKMFPEKVPIGLADLIESCLAKDPAARPTASELAHAFEPAIAAMPRRPVLGRRRPRLR